MQKPRVVAALFAVYPFEIEVERQQQQPQQEQHQIARQQEAPNIESPPSTSIEEREEKEDSATTPTKNIQSLIGFVASIFRHGQQNANKQFQRSKRIHATSRSCPVISHNPFVIVNERQQQQPQQQ